MKMGNKMFPWQGNVRVSDGENMIQWVTNPIARIKQNISALHHARGLLV